MKYWKKKGNSLYCLWLLLGLVSPAYAADWYASPTGMPSGAGTSAAPWDLATALRGGPSSKEVQPGDTVLLRGGTYLGKFTSRLTGTLGAPITVRSAPEEWAKIDGYATTTLATTVDATTRVISLANGTPWPDGSSMVIEREHIRLLTPRAGQYISSLRGLTGTTPASHTAGTPVVLGGNNLTVGGADAIYRDFEVMCSEPKRAGGSSSTDWQLRGAAVMHHGPRTKLINLVCHDGNTGIFTSEKAVDSEIYGCIVFNSGYVGDDADYHGHGIYGQNMTERKRFEDLIVFNNFNLGVKQESQTADTIGMDHVGVISFNSHSPRGTNTRRNSMLIGAHSGKADDITVDQCHLYIPPNCIGTPLKLGATGVNGKAVVTNSVVWGSYNALEINFWTPLMVSGNRVGLHQPTNITQLVRLRRQAGTSITWDNNQYFHSRYGASDCFSIDSVTRLSFAAWKQQTGFDTNSTYDPNLPTSPWVYVRPNRYETGRGHVVVYNWTKAPEVPVDLSALGLTLGQDFEIRSAEGWPAAVYRGSYSPRNPVVNVPMTAGSVARPIGHSVTPKSTLPDFGAFVVVPIGTPPPPPDPNIARAEAELSAWLSWAGSYAAGNSAFQARYQAILDAVRAPR